MAFHLTQGTFSFLPPLTDDEIKMQINYSLDHNWPLSVEFTDDPHKLARMGSWPRSPDTWTRHSTCPSIPPRARSTASRDAPT